MRVWPWTLPREQPPVEEVLEREQDFGTTFLEHFSPIVNRNYRAAERNAEIASVMAHINSHAEQPAMVALALSTGVIVRGNPWVADDLPGGVTIDDANLEFSFAKVATAVEETSNPDAEVMVAWYTCLRGEPSAPWTRVSVRRLSMVTSIARSRIILAGVHLDGSKKLSAGTQRVFFDITQP